MVGSSPEPLIKVTGRRVIQRPIAGTRPRGATEEEDVAHEKSLLGRREGAGGARDAGRPGPQRHRPGQHLRFGGGRGVHGDRALLARHAHDLAGGGGAGGGHNRAWMRSTHPSRRAPYRGPRRSGRWRSSTSSSPPAGAPTPEWSATSTCPGTWTPASPLRTGYVVDGKLYVQAGGGIVADSDPATEWTETVNKAKAVLTAWAMTEQGS